MRQLAEYICNQIMRNVTGGNSKYVFRIEGFEDLNLYARVCELSCTHFTSARFIAKLSRLKFEQLAADSPYAANIMRNNDWVDFDDRMTYYRNLVPDAGECMVILLMGTDVVADKGGLSDFFAITPYTLDIAIGDHVSRLMGAQLRRLVCGGDDTVEKICDTFFKTLFECVPRNLSRVSAIMDEWETQQPSPKEIIADLYRRLPEWGIPRIGDAVSHITASKYPTDRKAQKILRDADSFIRGKTFARITRNTQANIAGKFERYRDKPGKFALDYPASQAASSLDDLEQAVLNFVAGERGDHVMRRLLNTDYSILSDVLSLRQTRKATENAITLRGNPLIAFSSAIMQALSALDDEEMAITDTVRVELDKAYMAGIPPVSKSSDERDALLLEAWQHVTLFAGGIFPFLESENWELTDDTLLRIESSPENFTDPGKAMALLSEGRLTNTTGANTAHRVEFTIRVFGGDAELADLDFCWRIDPQEDWMTAFIHLPYMTEAGNAYIPYAIMPRLDAAFSLRDEDGFAYFIEHEKFELPSNRNALIELLRGSISSAADEQKELGNFYALGMSFMNFVKAMLQRGFYSVIGHEIPALIGEYSKLAGHIATSDIYASKLKHCVKYFVNAFTICPDREPLNSDIYIRQLIVPPYHPAALEKISDRMLFIRAGLKEWFVQENNMTGDMKADKKRISRLKDTIERLVSLSRIHNATDGFFLNPHSTLPCYRTFGYYTLYGKQQRSGSFISVQDVMRREMVFEDDFDDSQLKSLTREAQAVLRIIEQYMETYPRAEGQLKISFIDPAEMQVVVSALHKLVTDWQKAKSDSPFQLALTIVTQNEMYGARAYLSYWINNMFTQDDSIDIKAYVRLYDNEDNIADLVPEATDLVFLFDALNTQRNASCRFQPRVMPNADIMTDCRFPMVFKPGVTSANSHEHTIDITQWQFQAATEHTQVLCAYQNNYPNDRRYELVQSSFLDPRRGKVIRALQEKAVWLVCTDDAIDKRTIRSLYAPGTDIIGFTTGEGSFGQMNLAITARPELRHDMLRRCMRRLRMMFKGWDDDRLAIAAKNCIDRAAKLDGVSLLRAMNPHDYNINNYMAYLVANELCVQSASTDAAPELNVLIHLDSYRHWFRGDSLRPDFLLLSAAILPDQPLRFHATVIEAKLSKLSGMGEHLKKAVVQIREGMSTLQRNFDPQARSIEHRYWLAQLYRAIVFLQADMNYPTSVFRDLTDQLGMMMENHYEISWDGRILAMELDSPRYLDKDMYEEFECWHVGQYAFQNILLQRDIHSQADYEEDIAVDEGDGSDDEALWETEALEAIDAVREQTLSQPRDIPVYPEDTPYVPPTGADSQNSQQHTAHMPETAMPVEDIPQAQDVGYEQTNHATESIGQPTDGTCAVTQSSSHAAAETSSVAESIGQPAEEAGTGSLPLSRIRIPIGTDKGGKVVHWEFGHPGLANRHLLITGGSGQGKTYAIQAFLYELAKQNISSVVFDYTDGFLPDKLEPPFAEALHGKIEQHIAILDRIPINPFRRQTITIAGISMEDKSAQVAGRFASIMTHVYSFGQQQHSALYQACKLGIDRYGDKMNFRRLRELLDADDSTYAKSVLSKMNQLFDMDLFDVEHALDWAKLTERDGKVSVIQLTNLDREIQTIITELLMWDAWYSLVKTGNKDHPFVVVLDEAQNLSFADGSPAQKILQEGRKYGWSAWFATQFLKGALSSDEISRLQQAAEVLYFKPSGEETSWVGQQLADGNMSSAEWTQLIKGMQKGQCIVRGDRIRHNGTFGAAPATIVKVSSFESRH